MFNHVSGPSIRLGGYSWGPGSGVCSPGGPCETVCVCAAPTMCSVNMYVREGVEKELSHPSYCFCRVVPEAATQNRVYSVPRVV